MIVYEDVCDEGALISDNIEKIIIKTMMMQKDYRQCFDMLVSEFDVVEISDECKMWITYCLSQTYYKMVREGGIKTKVFLSDEEISRAHKYICEYTKLQCDEKTVMVDLVASISSSNNKCFFETLYEIWIMGITTSVLLG